MWTRPERILGHHLLLELSQCPRELLETKDVVESLLLQIAHAAGATVRSTTFEQFNPIGVSGVLLIAESHITIHTWPEYGYAAIDVFTCGDKEIPLALPEPAQKLFQAQKMQKQIVSRGCDF